jgi:hypothetical protein
MENTVSENKYLPRHKLFALAMNPCARCGLVFCANDALIYRLQCGHFMCQSCIKSFLQGTLACTVCNTVMWSHNTSSDAATFKAYKPHQALRELVDSIRHAQRDIVAAWDRLIQRSAEEIQTYTCAVDEMMCTVDTSSRKTAMQLKSSLRTYCKQMDVTIETCEVESSQLVTVKAACEKWADGDLFQAARLIDSTHRDVHAPTHLYPEIQLSTAVVPEQCITISTASNGVIFTEGVILRDMSDLVGSVQFSNSAKSVFIEAIGNFLSHSVETVHSEGMRALVFSAMHQIGDDERICERALFALAKLTCTDNTYITDINAIGNKVIDYMDSWPDNDLIQAYAAQVFVKCHPYMVPAKTTRIFAQIFWAMKRHPNSCIVQWWCIRVINIYADSAASVPSFHVKSVQLVSQALESLYAEYEMAIACCECIIKMAYANGILLWPSVQHAIALAMDKWETSDEVQRLCLKLSRLYHDYDDYRYMRIFKCAFRAMDLNVNLLDTQLDALYIFRTLVRNKLLLARIHSEYPTCVPDVMSRVLTAMEAHPMARKIQKMGHLILREMTYMLTRLPPVLCDE